jgi:fructoselysine 6-kinase
MRASFAAAGLDLAGLRIVADGRTAYTDIATREGGEREMVFEEFGVCRGYRPSEAEIATLRRKRHVHIGWLDDGGALKRRLAAAGVGVSQDLGVNADPRSIAADHLAIAFASAGPSEEKAAALLDLCLSAGARLAVVTMGALGSRASDGRQTAAAGSAPTHVVDTTGAGDSFVAGFLDARLRGLDLQSCLEAGRDLAAKACSHFGGFPQVLEPLMA